MIASGERLELRRPRQADHRQALHGRRRRQDHPAARPARRLVRRRGAAALRPRPRPHRRHARQAGVDPGVARDAHERRVAARSCAHVGAVICAAGAGPRPRRRQAVRAARHHRHRRGDPAHRVLDHVSKKIAEGTASLVLDVKFGSGAFMKDSTARASSPRPWCALGKDAGVATTAPAHQHERAARPRDRQRSAASVNSISRLRRRERRLLQGNLQQLLGELFVLQLNRRQVERQVRAALQRSRLAAGPAQRGCRSARQSLRWLQPSG